MTLLENWRNLAYGDGLDDKKKEELWSGYFTIEKGIYEQILARCLLELTAQQAKVDF